MSEKSGLIRAVFLVAVLFSVLVACGKSTSESGYYSYMSAAPAASKSAAAYDVFYEEAENIEAENIMPEQALAEYEYAGDFSASGSSQMLLSQDVDNLNLKLIYMADLTVQTLNFNESYNSLCSMVETFGGYFESAYKYNGSINSNGHPYGNYTIRIPSEKYSEFIGRISGETHLVDIRQAVQDVSFAYSDIEQRLETLNTKHERLISLLASAEKMEDIISLENALSDCEYQLDRYSSQKRKYDSLTGFSTINLNLKEVERLNPSVPEKPLSFGERLAKGIRTGWQRVAEFLSSALIWIVMNIGLVVFLCVLVILTLSVVSAKRKKRKAERLSEKKEEQPETEGLPF